MFPNPLDHALDVTQHFIVPEAQHSVASRAKGRFTARIGIALRRVMAAIDLDNEPFISAAKVPIGNWRRNFRPSS